MTAAGIVPSLSSPIVDDNDRAGWIALPVSLERQLVNVTVEDLAPCKKLLRVEVDATTVDKAFEEVTLDFVRHVSLPGFRPGKSPRHLVEKTFQGKIEDEVRRKLMPEAYKDALKEKGLRAVTNPEIEETQFGKGQALQFTATLEVQPQFELPNYKGLPAKRENRVVTDADLEKALGVLQEQRATYQDLDRPVQQGDYVVVDYTGSCEGKPIIEVAPSAKGLAQQTNFWILIQPEQYIPGFTDQLVGAKAGENRTVTVTFPAEFPVREVAGKPGVFDVLVRQVKQKDLPVVDEAFAKSLGANDLDHLRTGVRKDLENDLKFQLKRNVRNQLAAALSSQITCELPDALVENATRSAVYDIVRSNQQRGIPKDAIDQHKDEIYSAANTGAKERVKLTLILGRIAEKENIRVQEEEILREVALLARQYDVKPEKMLKQLDEQGALPQIHEQLLTSKVLDFLELHAQVEEVPAAS